MNCLIKLELTRKRKTVTISEMSIFSNYYHKNFMEKGQENLHFEIGAWDKLRPFQLAKARSLIICEVELSAKGAT